MTMEAFTADCGHEIPALPAGHCGGTGYALVRVHTGPDRRICYACAADTTRARMMRGEPVTLYLSRRGDAPDYHGALAWKVTDWPGALEFQPHSHNRTDAYAFGWRIPRHTARFTGPDGAEWTIDVRGNMQCGTARRLKRQPRMVAA